MISLPPTWRLVVFVAALGLLPTLLFVNWLARQCARSYLGAPVRGWWLAHTAQRPTHKQASDPCRTLPIDTSGTPEDPIRTLRR
jgi:hypothetical protein